MWYLIQFYFTRDIRRRLVLPLRVRSRLRVSASFRIFSSRGRANLWRNIRRWLISWILAPGIVYEPLAVTVFFSSLASDNQRDRQTKVKIKVCRFFIGKGKSLDTCYSATYVSQTCDQQRFTISEVAANWHEPMVLQSFT